MAHCTKKTSRVPCDILFEIPGLDQAHRPENLVSLDCLKDHILIHPSLKGIIHPRKVRIAPENGWLGDYFHFGFRPIFRGKLLVSGRVPRFE